jgi:hypothetical protein
MLNPKEHFKDVPAVPMEAPETSPATHLAKVRKYNKHASKASSDYERVVNRMWRRRYIWIYEDEGGK